MSFRFKLTALSCLALLEVTQPVIGWVILNGLDCKRFRSPRGGINTQEYKDYKAVLDLYGYMGQSGRVLRRLLGMKEEK